MNELKTSGKHASRHGPARWLSCEVLLGIALLTQSCSAQAQAYCLRYERTSLTGTLVRQTYPGPPDYESVTKGDEPRVILILLLEHSICVVDPDPGYPREYFEREIQLVLSRPQREDYKRFLGKKVDVTGELMPGGAKYEKRLVLKVEEMTRRQR